MASENNNDFVDDEHRETEPDGVGNKRKKIAMSSSSLPPKEPKKSNPRSEVWNHFTRRDDDNNKCNCRYCGRLLSCNTTTSGTSSLRNHLKICKHYKAFEESKSQQILNHDGIGGGNLKLMTVTQEVFRKSINEILVLGELPLSFVDGLAFKHFCSKFLPSYTIHSRRTATRDIIEMYVKEKAVLKNLFMVTEQRVSLTTNIWIAPTTSASYMFIIAHFTDASWHLRKKIIGFKHITDHKRTTIANVLLDCLDDWGIKKIFTITVDNATANYSALVSLRNTLRSQGNGTLVQDREFMHMRCCAHILNLIVKDGLQEVDDSVTAIRNAVMYVRSSYARLKSFELRVDTGKMTRGSLSLDCTTRWNSTYLMLTRALKFRLAFDKMLVEDMLYNDYFKEEKDDGKKRVGPPTSDDWEKVQLLVMFLNIFYQSTLVVSGSNHVTSSSCYNEICTIEANLISLSNNSDSMLRTKANAMRAKFGKYWDGLERINRLLIVASVFDPRNKMQFASLCFERLYGKDTAVCIALKESINDVMCRLFEEYSARYAIVNNVGTSSQIGTSSQVDSFEPGGADNLYNDIHYERLDLVYDQMVSDKGNEDTSNELDIYLMGKVETRKKNYLGMDFDLLSWWRTNSSKFPILSEIARDILAIQVSTIASESAFSTSGRLLNLHRSSLNHYMIEVLMCTEQWLRSDTRSEEVLSIQQMMEETEFFDSLAREYQKECDGLQ